VLWDQATEGLRMALDAHGLDYVVDEGGGAFYGPKIDVDVKDAIGRAWQLSTIQLDFNLPDRFGLEYIATDGERKQPVMIHRALLGSIERFFGVLIEHYAGAFPAWLAPTQVRVLPVADVHDDHAHAVASRLRSSGFRVDVVSAVDGLGKRVRNGKVEKLPYILVVGDDDVANDTVGVNMRGQDKPERDITVDAFIERLRAEVDEKR
jgi:threonyl-tRNA synthetase